jgi:hypothetical protein
MLQLHILQAPIVDTLYLVLHAQADPHAQISCHLCPAAVSASYSVQPAKDSHVLSNAA